jgi:hypothetical protein
MMSLPVLLSFNLAKRDYMGPEYLTPTHYIVVDGEFTLFQASKEAIERWHQTKVLVNSPRLFRSILYFSISIGDRVEIVSPLRPLSAIADRYLCGSIARGIHSPMLKLTVHFSSSSSPSPSLSNLNTNAIDNHVDENMCERYVLQGKKMAWYMLTGRKIHCDEIERGFDMKKNLIPGISRLPIWVLKRERKKNENDEEVKNEEKGEWILYDCEYSHSSSSMTVADFIQSITLSSTTTFSMISTVICSGIILQPTLMISECWKHLNVHLQLYLVLIEISI